MAQTHFPLAINASCIGMRVVAFGMGIAYSPTAGETSCIGLGKASWVGFGRGSLIMPGETSWVSFRWLAFGVGSGCLPMVSETCGGGLRWVAFGMAQTRFLSAGDASCVSIQGYVVGVS